MTNPNRIAKDFLYPQPSIVSRLTSKLFAPQVAYEEFIDESYWQYTNGRVLNHKAALNGGYRATIIRATDGLSVDAAYKNGNWKSALDDGQLVMVYHNNRAQYSGASQADFHLNTIKTFLDEVGKTHTCVWMDCEYTGDAVNIATRKQSVLTFTGTINNQGIKVGVYSNIKYWSELYGNMSLPPYVYLWGAHWTPDPMGKFPASWNLDMLAGWQYAVWDKYYWAREVPGNVPDICVDKWVWKYGNIATFLNIPAPPPEPSHTHDEFEIISRQIISLQGQVNALDTRIDELEQKIPPQPPIGRYFQVIEPVAVARYEKSKNQVGKPIMEIWTNTNGDRLRYFNGTKVLVDDDKVDADSDTYYYKILQPTGVSIPLYVRVTDGVLI